MQRLLVCLSKDVVYQQTCNEQFCVRQLCKAYMHFMTELATLICTERGLVVNKTQINKEVMRILEFESDLANVRHLGFSSGFLLPQLYTTATLPETPTGLLSVLNYCFLSSGNMRCKWLQQHLTLLLLCPPHCQATDTQEDRSNPGFLYNKMELGDLNANFTIEVDSQVLNRCSFIRISAFFSLAQLPSHNFSSTLP